MTELSLQKKRELVEHGFTMLPGTVPANRVRAALHAINASIGLGMDRGEMEIFQNQSFCPELREEPVITALYHQTAARAIVESAVGRKVSCHPKAQIALRFPLRQTGPFALYPHIDGFYTDKNGLPPGRIGTFMGLVAIFLNDVEEELAGNFTVWPGTHQLFERYFREHEPRPDLPNGIPPIPLPAPLQIKAKAGDMLLAHYQLAHTAAPNLSPWVRYAVFFRFDLEAHVKQATEVFRHIWVEWEGLGV